MKVLLLPDKPLIRKGELTKLWYVVGYKPKTLIRFESQATCKLYIKAQSWCDKKNSENNCE